MRPAARYLRFDAIDFQHRDWVQGSGWPFGRADLDPYYERAERLVGIAAARSISEGELRRRAFRLDGVQTTLERFGPADVFTRELPVFLGASPHANVVTHATATAIRAGADGRTATGVWAQTPQGRSLTIQAEIIVLAAGAIENARLLLLSTGSRSAGLGNGHGVVGRYFMDHHRVNGGRLVPTSTRIFRRAALYDFAPYGGSYLMGKLTLAEDAMRANGLLNSSTLLWPRPGERDDLAVDAARPLVAALRQGALNRRTWTHAQAVGRGLPYLIGTGVPLAIQQGRFPPAISGGGWSRLPGWTQRYRSFEVVHQVEQAPNRNNRVTLGEGRDALGLPVAQVTSRWSELDVLSVKRTQALLASSLQRAGVGAVVDDSRAEPLPELHNEGGIYHHMGTTRMHVDPRQGVVDADSRVHGMTNLYVTGGSVFPTGGYANPTLTILALAIRLADHVARRVRVSPRWERRRSTAPELGGDSAPAGVSPDAALADRRPE
jgi:choline dehydrogenase-like flavoprotein